MSDVTKQLELVQEDNNNMRVMLGPLSAIIKEMSADRKALKLVQEDNNNLRAMLDSQSSDIKEISADTKVLKQEIVATNRRENMSDRVINKLGLMQVDNTNLRANLDSQHAIINEMSADTKVLKHELAATSRKVKFAIEDLDTAHGEIRHLQIALEVATEALEELKPPSPVRNLNLP